ncbi:MAG: ABC transporter ATP-binding protein [Spirochaetota bacterium]
MAVIEVDALEKTYPGGIKALDGISLTVGKGEVFGLLGPNGAGKTTTVRILNGTLQPDKGTFSVLGLDTADERLRKRTATMSENSLMYESLSIEENIRFFAAMYEMEEAEVAQRLQQLLTRMQLWERRADKLGTLSTGLKKRVQLARTLMHSPELLFLDEPTSGLDPDSARQVNSLIRTLAEEYGTSVFLCTHNLPRAEEICDSFGFISEGKIVRSGSKEEIIESIGDDTLVHIKTTAGETIEEHIENPTQVNTILSRLIEQGVEISEVIRPKPTLEEAYFHYIGRSDHELV